MGDMVSQVTEGFPSEFAVVHKGVKGRDEGWVIGMALAVRYKGLHALLQEGGEGLEGYAGFLFLALFLHGYPSKGASLSFHTLISLAWFPASRLWVCPT